MVEKDQPKLWNHQLLAIDKFKDSEYGALFFEPGLGKSATIIHLLRHKYNSNRRILRTLILCPAIVVKNWKNEFAIHSKVPQSKITCLIGSGKERCKAVSIISEKDPNHIFIVNYEAFTTPDQTFFNLIERWQPEVIICDESHKIKNPSAKRTKRVLKLSQNSIYRYILSGSPVLNSLMDLFSQFLFLDHGVTFGKNFYVFRAQYFYDKNASIPKQRYFPGWTVKPGSLELVNQKIDRISVKAKKSECLDLPDLVRQVIKVPMTPEQRRIYLELKQDLICFLNDKACVAQLAMVKALRLMQIASGYVKATDGQEIEIASNPKKEALKELLEEITPHHKAIVWAVFKQNYKQIMEVCEELKLGYTLIHGEISTKGKVEAVDAFYNNPDIRVLIANPGAGGTGINLVVASYSLFYSRNFSLEHALQAEARNYRAGSEIHPKITRIDLITENSIDELVAEKLAAKQEISMSILEELRNE